MAILAMDGFDTYTNDMTTTGIMGKWVPSTPPPNNNGYHLSMTEGLLSGQALMVTCATRAFDFAEVMMFPFPALLTSFSVGFHGFLNGTVGQGGCESPFRIGYSLSGAVTNMFSLNVDPATRSLILVNHVANVSVYSDISVKIYENIWYHFYISRGAGVVRVYLNGVLVITYNETSATLSIVTVCGFMVRCGAYATSGFGGYLLVDNVFVSDSATFIGERRVTTLRPKSNALGGVTQWTPSEGYNNFELISDYVTDTTGYVSANTAGLVDEYSLGSYAGNAITVDAIQIGAVAQKVDAGVRAFQLGINSGGTIDNGPTQTVSTTWSRFTRVLNTDPHTSGAWSISAVEGLILRPISV